MAFVNVLSEEFGGNRTIDYERGAVLQRGGGAWYARVPGGYFTIHWKECDIVISQYENTEIYKEDGSSAKITYNIVTCEYPEKLRPYRNEIIQMIREGLDAYGINHGKLSGTTIEVNIDPSIGNLNPNYNWDTQKFESAPIQTI